MQSEFYMESVSIAFCIHGLQTFPCFLLFCHYNMAFQEHAAYSFDFLLDIDIDGI